MKRVIFKNIIISLICLALSLVLILVIEKFELTLYKKYILILFVVLYFMATIYINKGLFINVKNNYLRYLLVIVLCSLLTVAVGFIAFVIMVNFDLAIGGHL